VLLTSYLLLVYTQRGWHYSELENVRLFVKFVCVVHSQGNIMYCVTYCDICDLPVIVSYLVGLLTFFLLIFLFYVV